VKKQERRSWQEVIAPFATIVIAPVKRKTVEELKMAQRAGHLKSKYGLSIQDYKKILTAQNNECAICKRDIKDFNNVDHDHVTGKVRGLLCETCNFGLGLFYDDTDYLLAAVQYLIKSRV
jgi:hypothetical protein